MRRDTKSSQGERSPYLADLLARADVGSPIDLLEPSQAHLELALEATGTGLWTWDVRDDAVSWSVQCHAITGVPVGEAPTTGQAFFALVHADDRARVRQTVTDAIAQGRLYECEFRLLRPDGAVAWVANRGRVVHDAQGHPVRMLGTLHDISDRVHARTVQREAETLHRELARQLPHGAAFVVDQDLRFRLAEGQALAAVGMAPADFEGRHVADVAEPALRSQMEQDYRGALAGQPFVREHTVGGRHFVTHGVPLHVDGRPVSALAVSYDITDRVVHDRLALRDAERVQLALSAGAIIGTWVWDVPRDVFLADELFARSFGIDAEACREGLPLEAVAASIHPDDREGVQQAMDEALARGGPYCCQYRVRRADGQFYWVEANGRVELDAAGQPVRFPGVLLDVHERRSIEAERDDALALLRGFVEAVPGVVYAKDRAGRLLLANRGTGELVGQPVESLLGRTDREFLRDPAQAEAVMANDARIMRTGLPEMLEERVDMPDGRATYWLSSKAPLRDATGAVVGLVGASIDITERRSAMQALARSEARLSAVLDALPVGVIITDAAGAILRDNAAHRELWGMPPLTSRWQVYGDWEGYWPRNGRRIAAHEWGLARALRTGEVVRAELVENVPFGGGARRAYLNNAAPVRDEAGQIVGGVAAELDVTERVATERALKARERELKTLADNTPDILARFDPQLRHTFVNLACEKVLGLPAAEVVGRTNRELGMPAHLCELWEGKLHAVFASGQPQTLEFGFEGPQGPSHWSSLLVPEFDDAGKVASVLTVARDVTQRVAHEQLLQQQDRRKDVFLATLAHELRNPLAPIRNGLAVLQRMLPPGEGPARRTLVIMERQLAHLVHLVDDLLDISRINQDKITLRLESLVLQEVVAAAADAARPMIDAQRHALELALPVEPATVQGDRTRLVQVVTNLLVNAAKYSNPDGSIRVDLALRDGHACIRVHDKGLGIAAEMLPRIWNLFAQNDDTLDRAQGGLGIGLALVRKLVELHGGTVHAASDGPGHGSTFTVCLPLPD